MAALFAPAILWNRVLLVSFSWAIVAMPLVFADAAKAADAPPTDAEVKQLLSSEPFSLETWPKWRPRLLQWIVLKNHAADPAYEAARKFMLEQGGDRGTLTGPLANDAVAWYLLGSAQLYGAKDGAKDGAGAKQNAAMAEVSLRRSLKLDPKFSRSHRNLALVLLIQDDAGGSRRAEAERELAEAARLDPDLPLSAIRGQAAMMKENFGEAVTEFRKAMQEEPEDDGVALGFAQCLLQGAMKSKTNDPSVAPEIGRLCDKFPQDGRLACLHAIALAMNDDARAARAELHRARALGVEPETVLTKDIVDKIEEFGAPSWLETGLYGGVVFAAVYAVIMIAMVLLALLLAPFTRGAHALQLAGAEPTKLIQFGQVARSTRESLLAKAYALLLVIGLVLFYVAVPFVVVGLLAGTAGLLYLILLTGHVPIKLFVIIAILGLVMAGSVIKSLFVRMNREGFGILKTRAQEPRLYEMLDEVARRVDTRPVDEVYLAPGSDIGVHQTGRGPFGLFGAKNRVLTLGLSSLQFLTADELRSVLAHEYAHFSHGDTFFSRFIFQVTASIEQSLAGIGGAGGKLSYVNPFFWFIYLYWRAYSMMAAGFSRSREYLADRMAASLYGSNVFGQALTMVATRGSYSESLMYNNVVHLLESDQMCENIYGAYRDYEAENPEDGNREKAYREAIGRKSSLFASHPTIPERVEAVKGLPTASRTDDTPAASLLVDPVASEKELSEFIAGYFHHMKQLHAAAAAQD
ncbi:MAG: M48 family metalloprotease [Planctomycetes bacterium]|nr:M48 family metalloprotease [Planctomycetota bacterium]